MSPRLLLVSAAVGVTLLAAPTVLRPRPWLVWNATPSAPIGFYAVGSDRDLWRGDWAVIRPPPRLARQLADGGYLPVGVPLLKRLAALEGQRVCRTGAVVSIDRAPVARALATDRRGRPLPSWSGCVRLRRDQIFALNADVPDSLDSRYFGPLPASAVVGRAHLVWSLGVRR